MALHRIKKGLDLPISGEPEQVVEEARLVRHVAVVASDFVGMKPRWEVQDGDVVKRGSLLFEDRRSPGVRFTAPASGRVSAIHRGAKRSLQSVVIELNDNELNGTLTVGDFERLEAFAGVPVAEMDAAVAQLTAQLLQRLSPHQWCAVHLAITQIYDAVADAVAFRVMLVEVDGDFGDDRCRVCVDDETGHRLCAGVDAEEVAHALTPC